MGAVTWDIMKGMTFRSEFGFENNSEESDKRRFGKCRRICRAAGENAAVSAPHQALH